MLKSWYNVVGDKQIQDCLKQLFSIAYLKKRASTTRVVWVSNTFPTRNSELPNLFFFPNFADHNKTESLFQNRSLGFRNYLQNTWAILSDNSRGDPAHLNSMLGDDSELFSKNFLFNSNYVGPGSLLPRGYIGSSLRAWSQSFSTLSPLIFFKHIFYDILFGTHLL